ncbi:PAS domain-containing sensor histidine kinase [Pontibacter sp. H249]|uniref:PAS domain-containing sensor histidine kinase n=1 Tax=Pontibacter sp. H249 TaxID=3133420 RepID=UPI0030C17C7D
MKSKYISESITSNFIDQVKEYAIFAMDANGIIETWNEGAQRMKGYTAEDVIGKYYGMLFTDEDRAQHKPEQELEEAKHQEQFMAEGWRQKKDGSLFWANITLTPIYSEEKQLIGLTKVTKDLTDKRLAEEELTRKHNELTLTNRDLDNFIYTASHDLKAPILNIDGLVQRLTYLFEQKGIQDQELEKLVGYIQKSVNRFKSTIEDLTTISRLKRTLDEEGKEEQVVVQTVFDDILADVMFLSKEFELPCQIKSNFEVKTLYFSRKNFRSILYNLLSNSIKYRSQTNPCQIEVKTFREDDWVVLAVKDNGLGISQKDQKNLFTMFKRFHDHVDGSGIGLYIVKRIVDNAGGHIKLTSKVGEGTEFKVYFPVKGA